MHSNQIIRKNQCWSLWTKKLVKISDFCEFTTGCQSNSRMGKESIYWIDQVLQISLKYNYIPRMQKNLWITSKIHQKAAINFDLIKYTIHQKLTSRSYKEEEESTIHIYLFKNSFQFIARMEKVSVDKMD